MKTLRNTPLSLRSVRSFLLAASVAAVAATGCATTRESLAPPAAPVVAVDLSAVSPVDRLALATRAIEAGGLAVARKDATAGTVESETSMMPLAASGRRAAVRLRVNVRTASASVDVSSCEVERSKGWRSCGTLSLPREVRELRDTVRDALVREASTAQRVAVLARVAAR